MVVSEDQVGDEASKVDSSSGVSSAAWSVYGPLGGSLESFDVGSEFVVVNVLGQVEAVSGPLRLNEGVGSCNVGLVEGQADGQLLADALGGMFEIRCLCEYDQEQFIAGGGSDTSGQGQ